VSIIKLPLAPATAGRPRLAFNSVRTEAEGARGRGGAGVGSNEGKGHIELALLAFGVLAEATGAAASLQDDLGALGCVQLCVDYLEVTSAELMTDDQVGGWVGGK
jgi:hypothetical protein